MATIANLNIRLGFQVDTRTLREVEGQMKSLASRLSSLGDRLTVAVSAPLAAVGVAAIKSVGDMESLTLALQSQLGSAAAAGKKLQALTEAAKNPGLGVEQAVRGSVRLQGVALSAEEARKVLIQMGNAIAATGGTAQELDNVTRQFAQMISKGRVLQEDVTILSENMPGLAQLMQKAFGTTSVEAIREMGIGGKEFVLQITKAAESLPRVEGGIKNGIGNAIDSLKQSAAQIGLSLNKAFDITGAIDTVAQTVSTLAAAFADLDPGVQKAILGFAGIALVAGPVVKLFGSNLAFAIGAFKDTIKATTATLLGLESAFARVKIAFGIIGIVTALTVALYGLTQSFDASEFAAEKFAQAQDEVIKQTSEEVGAVNQAFEALKKDGATRFEKGKIIDDLNKKYPDLLKHYDLESASVAGLTEVQKKLNEEILRGVAERQKAAAVQAIFEKQAQLMLRVQQLRDGAQQTAGESALIDTGDMIREGGIVNAVIKKMEEQIVSLGQQATTVSAQFDKAFGTYARAIDPALDAEYAQRDAYYASREALEEKSKTVQKTTAHSNKYAEVLKEINDATATAKLLGDDEDVAKVEALRRGIERLIEAGFKPASAQVQNLKNQLDALKKDPVVIDQIAPRPVSQAPLTSTAGSAPLPQAPEPFKPIIETGPTAISIMEGLRAKTLEFSEAFAQTAKIIAENGTVVQQGAMAIANAVTSYAEQGGASFREFGVVALQAAAKVVRSFIMQGVAAAASKALQFVPFPFNIAAGAVAGAAAGVLFNKLIQSIGVPAFARGTRDAPGGLALVGERGPELINLPRHSQVYPAPQTSAMLNGLGGGGVVGGTIRFDGNDLYLLLEKQNTRSNRTRGRSFG